MAVAGPVTCCYLEDGTARYLCRFSHACPTCDDILLEAWDRMTFGGCIVIAPKAYNPGGPYTISVQWT